ncbi:Ca2+-transporting ATPase [Halanaerobacter jeridensis]|uniref:Ca2+-transporting ATPase n=1 Tax=Halanaerobacter jeridensis TaxID=706427 RepID=A0A939BMF9_9FIRM|nr:Ca2+-transporting ATPase [Halanaerobacter jeridensis]
MLVAAIAAFAIGDVIEGAAVLAVIIFNGAFGFITEYKAEKSLAALKEVISPTAKVIRGGKTIEIEATEVVPGDILVIEEGDRVAADGRLLDADKLQINESLLTGESETVAKDHNFTVDEEIALAERENMVYMGTSVTRGNAEVLVTGTGTDTEMGQISDMLQETEQEETPLEERLDTMGKALVKITLVVAVIVTGIGILVGQPIKEMIKTGIALAIASVPEGLPIVATITLAIGMNKMVDKNALVRRLSAVETLGSTTTICTDKTGTITENQMTLRQIILPDAEINVTGTGYEPQGEFEDADGSQLTATEKKNLDLFLQSGALCSNAAINQDETGAWKVVGDPTEGALVTAAHKAGYDKEKMEDNDYQRLEEIPFSSELKYMAVSYEIPDGDYIFVKGAPDVVLEMCDQELTTDGKKELTEQRIDELTERNQALAQNGLRVLAVAYRADVRAETEAEIEEAIESSLVFAGLAGIMDPPRQEAANAIQEAQAAGIETKMITGDQRDTAVSIAEKVGISKDSNSDLSGQEFDAMTTAERSSAIKTHSVFTRVSPENKLEIIDALNQNNEITAMTGDGVNDAPALKKADIGVAMGQRGTSVAKNTADIVLLDDSFSTIVSAIKQGRIIFDNIKKFMYYLFSSNLSKIILIFLGIVLQVPVPMLALQILWLNLVIDVFPALSLGWEVAEPNVMSRSPRDPDKPILHDDFKKEILLHSSLIAAGALVTYLIVLNSGYSVELSRTISFAVFSFTQLLHAFNVRRQKGTGYDKSVLENPYLILSIVVSFLLQILAIYNPFLQTVLKTTAIPLGMWPAISLGFIIPNVIIQVLKIRQSST